MFSGGSSPFILTTFSRSSGGSGAGFGFQLGAIVAGATGNTPTNGFMLSDGVNTNVQNPTSIILSGLGAASTNIIIGTGSFISSGNGAGSAGFFLDQETNLPAQGVLIEADVTDTMGSSVGSAGAIFSANIFGSNVAGDFCVAALFFAGDRSSGGNAAEVSAAQFGVQTASRTVLGTAIHIISPSGPGTTTIGMLIDNQGANIPAIRMTGSTSGTVDLIPAAAVGTGTVATFLAITGNVPIEVATPSTAASAGVAGAIAYDATHIYVCVATNTWVRALLATF